MPVSKIKPAGKAVIALLVLVPVSLFAYFNYFQDALQNKADTDLAAASTSADGAGAPSKAAVAAGAGGSLKDVKVAKVNAQGVVQLNKAGKPIVEMRAERVYNVCLSQWPGHMAGIIACGGLTTQPGSFCSTVRSSFGGDPGIQINTKFLEDPIAKNAALIKGECDFVWQTVDELPLNYGAFQDSGVKAAAFVQIDSSIGGDACVAANGIKTPRDALNGKGAAMMRFTPDHTLFEFWVNNSDLSPKEVNQLRAKTRFHDTDPTFGANLFIKGDVDVACLWEPDVSNALRERPGSYRVFSTADARSLIADVLLARTSFLKKNPGVAEKVARVFMEGGKIGRSDKDAAARLLSNVVPRFRDELGYAGTRKSFDWVRWNDLGDNVGLYGLGGGTAQFDAIYKQADHIWSEYIDPNTGDPVLSQSFKPHTLRNRSILAPIYQEAEAERAAAARVATSRGEAAPAAIAPAKVVYNPTVARTGKATLSKAVTINFDTAAFALSTGACSIIKKTVLSQVGLAEGMSIRVEGNTDDVGKAKSNQVLSAKRANSVRQYLISQGIVPTRIAAKGNGEDNPLCNAKTPACRTSNRRTDIVFISNSSL